MSRPVILVIEADEFATVRAALAYYIAGKQGDPARRSDTVHDLAQGLDDDRLCEVISLDQDACKALAAKLPKLPTAAEVLGAVAGARSASSPSAAAYLETGAALALEAVGRWSSGDLAGAVNALEEWADDVKEEFPGLDISEFDEDEDGDAEEDQPAATPDPVSLCVLDIRPGDLVDLQGAPGVTEDGFPAAEFEFYTVCGVERETPDCLRIDFEGAPSLGIDASANLPVIKREFTKDAQAWAAEELAQQVENQS